jgi:drug/metabolite transporter (DMT)-like permease
MVGNSRKPASKSELIAGGTMMLTVGALLMSALLLAERNTDVPFLASIAAGAIALFVTFFGLVLLLRGLRHKP